MASGSAEAVVTEQIRLLNEGDVAGSAATFAEECLNHGIQAGPARVCSRWSNRRANTSR